MKKLIFLSLFVAFNSLASECPVLTGTYHCSFSDNTYSPLKITQEGTSELMTYSMTYTNFNYGADIVKASQTGVVDELGWVTRCEKNKLLSVTTDGGAWGEIYLNQEKALVRTFNGVVVQSCPFYR